MSTVSYFADDMAAAREWYTDLLGIEPYFVRPEGGPPLYIEYRYYNAGVVDPFGNVLGIFYNPHYLEVLEQFTNPTVDAD